MLFNGIIFQANLCSSESLANGSHYNRCWRVHEPFAETLERLLIEKFIDYKQLAIPETVIAFTESIQVKDNDETVVNDQGVQEFHRQYLEFRERCRVADFGKTAQFWVALTWVLSKFSI